MKITFLGHATLEIQINEFNLLVDPFISGNPMASEINLDDLKPDFILISHAHQDHTLDVEKLAKDNNSLIISNFEIVSHFQSKGLNGHLMNHGGKWNFDFGELKYVNAIHTSTFPDGSNFVSMNASTYSSKGTPYCKPKDIAIAKLFIIAFTSSPSLLVSINISPIFPSSYSPV